MADLVASSLKAYFTSLTATSNIVSEYGSTFTFGTNLFIGFEEDVDECLSLIPYGGEPPSKEGDRQNPAIQIELKSASKAKALKTMQSIINALHNNKSVCRGRIQARNSSPIMFGIREAGKSTIVVSNYYIKHVKL